MGAKRALVVDDSKSARTFLSRILEKYEIDVDSAESAEQAIEYLGTHRPDVIFMDHLMPGMDGFQAVQAIKNNPRTAMIPIMMYTSQEGELYLGQARALGAVGVLPKQIKPTDVSTVLYQLHLVPDRRTGEQSSFRPVAVATGDSDTEHESLVAPKPLTDATLREHFADLRRVLVASLDSQTDRVTSDVRLILQDAHTQTQAPAAEQASARPRRSAGAWALAVPALVIASVSSVGWWQEAAQRQRLATEILELRGRHAAASPIAPGGAGNAQQHAAQPVPAIAPPDAIAPIAPTAAAAASTDSAAPGAATAPPPAAAATATKAQGPDASQPLVEIVPYGAEPLAEPRLEVLRQLFDRLTAESFRGTVEIKSYGGRFCLVGNAGEGYSLPSDESPFAKCDVLGGPVDDVAAQAQRVPLAFANLMGDFRTRNHGAVDVQLLAGDPTALAVPYPQISESLTAGEWNRAASANNRIEIRVR